MKISVQRYIRCMCTYRLLFIHKYRLFLCSLISFEAKFHWFTGFFKDSLRKKPSSFSDLSIKFDSTNDHPVNTALLLKCCLLWVFSLDHGRDLWQMTALPVSKWILVCRLFLPRLVPNSLILFKKEHPTACHAFLRCWWRSSSSL